MTAWRVTIEYRVRGYVVVNAESAAAAEAMVADSDYEEIVGEDRHGEIEVLFAEPEDAKP